MNGSGKFVMILPSKSLAVARSVDPTDERFAEGATIGSGVSSIVALCETASDGKSIE